MICTILIKPEINECQIEGVRLENSTENVYIEEQTAICGELDTTVRVKYPKKTQPKETCKPNDFVVSVDVHNKPVDKYGQHFVNQLHLQNTPLLLQVQIYEDSIISKSYKISVEGKESNIGEKQNMVRFRDTVDIRQYEKDTLAERTREYKVMSEKLQLLNKRIMQTVMADISICSVMKILFFVAMNDLCNCYIIIVKNVCF